MQVLPAKRNHTLPPRARVDLHRGDAVTLAEFERLMRPFAARRKKAPSGPAAPSGGA
jgi:hypothetical protein